MPIRVLCMIILLPIMYITLICVATSRAFKSYYDDFDDKNKVKNYHFALGNYDYDLINFYIMNVFYIIVICFVYYKKKLQLIL